MLDIWTLLLMTPEDRYAPAPALRAAERRLYRVLTGAGYSSRPAAVAQEAGITEPQA